MRFPRIRALAGGPPRWLYVVTLLAMVLLRWQFLDLFFRNPEDVLSEARFNPARAERPTRVVIAVLDGLRADMAFDERMMPFLNRVVKPKAAYGIAQASHITGTTQGVRAIVSGARRNYLELPGLSEKVEADSILRRAKEHGYAVYIAGGWEADWRKKYKGHFDHAYMAKYIGPRSRRKDRQAAIFVRQIGRRPGPTVALIHFWDHENVGHAGGIRSAWYRESIAALDSYLEQVVSGFGKDTVFLFASDHGVLENGGHGGDSPLERDAPFFFFGKGIVAGGPLRIKQVDIGATLAAILDLPRPLGCIGRPLVSILAEDARGKARILESHLEQQAAGTLRLMGRREEAERLLRTSRQWIARGRFAETTKLIDRYLTRVQSEIERPSWGLLASAHLIGLLVLAGLWTRWAASAWGPAGRGALAFLWALLAVGTLAADDALRPAALPIIAAAGFAWLLRSRPLRLIALAALSTGWFAYIVPVLGDSSPAHFQTQASFTVMALGLALAAHALLARAYCAPRGWLLASIAILLGAQAVHLLRQEWLYRSAVLLFGAAVVSLPFLKLSPSRKKFALLAACACILRVFANDAELLLMLPLAMAGWLVQPLVDDGRGLRPAAAALFFLPLIIGMSALKWAPALGHISFNPGFLASTTALNVYWIGAVVTLRYVCAAALLLAALLAVPRSLELHFMASLFLDAGIVGYLYVNGLESINDETVSSLLWWAGLLFFNLLFLASRAAVEFSLTARPPEFRRRESPALGAEPAS